MQRLACSICGKEDVPLLEAYVKGKGSALVCPDCWGRLMEENKIVMGTSGGCACG